MWLTLWSLFLPRVLAWESVFLPGRVRVRRGSGDTPCKIVLITLMPGVTPPSLPPDGHSPGFSPLIPHLGNKS